MGKIPSMEKHDKIIVVKNSSFRHKFTVMSMFIAIGMIAIFLKQLKVKSENPYFDSTMKPCVSKN